MGVLGTMDAGQTTTAMGCRYLRPPNSLSSRAGMRVLTSVCQIPEISATANTGGKQIQLSNLPQSEIERYGCWMRNGLLRKTVHNEN
jgi:hypothetical protein